MIHSWRLAILSAVVLACLGAPSSVAAQTEAEVSYPIIFTDPKDLALLGIGIHRPSDPLQPVHPHTCYMYGQESPNVNLLSVSDAFLARWTARGFTRESLCLALVSEARFDPETGKRLPTYIVRYESDVRDLLKGRDPKTVPAAELRKMELDITEELPLRVPSCFKNGTPYLDCVWRYGMKSGRKLPVATTNYMREFGEALDLAARDAMQSGKLEKRDVTTAPYLPITAYWGVSDFYPGQPKSVQIPERLWDSRIDFRWSVIAPAFPRGYGYALNATGELGDGATAFSILDRLGERRLATRLSAARLRRLVDDE